MAFWPFWQSSANKLVIFIISCIYLYFCLWKINSSSSSSSRAYHWRVQGRPIARRWQVTRQVRATWHARRSFSQPSESSSPSSSSASTSVRFTAVERRAARCCTNTTAAAIVTSRRTWRLRNARHRTAASTTKATTPDVTTTKLHETWPTARLTSCTLHCDRICGRTTAEKDFIAINCWNLPIAYIVRFVYTNTRHDGTALDMTRKFSTSRHSISHMFYIVCNCFYILFYILVCS